jgi:HK97 family phage major capsid protein
MTADLMDTLAAPLAPPSRTSPHYRADAPGAALDGQEWAKTWATFLRAVNHPRDAFGAKRHIKNVMSERVPAEGGFLVPELLRSQVMAYMTAAIMRPRAMVLPMGSMRLPIPTLDNPSQAGSAQALGGLTFGFAEEGAAIAAATPAFGRTVLEARKLAALMQNTPNELVDDAAGAFGDFLARVIAMGLAWVEDDYFIGSNGTGVGCPQGILNAPCAVGIDRNTSGQVLFADVVAMFKGLHPASKQAGLTSGVTTTAWLMSASVMDYLLELYYNAGAGPTPISPSGWFTMGDGGDVAPSMLGLPAIVTDHQPAIGATGDLVLADLRHYLIGDRLEMVVEPSRSGPSYIYDATDIRVKSRVDGRYWIQSASTTEANQSVSPVVVLDVHT